MNRNRKVEAMVALTLDVEHHLGLHRAHVVGGGAAVLSGVGLRHLADLQHALLHHDVGRQRAAHLAPAHRGLGVADGLALKLHRVAHHHRLDGGAHVDHHLGQRWAGWRQGGGRVEAGERAEAAGE